MSHIKTIDVSISRYMNKMRNNRDAVWNFHSFDVLRLILHLRDLQSFRSTSRWRQFFPPLLVFWVIDKPWCKIRFYFSLSCNFTSRSRYTRFWNFRTARPSCFRFSSTFSLRQWFSPFPWNDSGFSEFITNRFKVAFRVSVSTINDDPHDENESEFECRIYPF